uniref:Putative secreted protein n=1 Tax=Ixodes ricinus TaxID=34613 RepID=A0A6B0UVT2_IXORI
MSIFSKILFLLIFIFKFLLDCGNLAVPIVPVARGAPPLFPLSSGNISVTSSPPTARVIGGSDTPGGALPRRILADKAGQRPARGASVVWLATTTCTGHNIGPLPLRGLRRGHDIGTAGSHRHPGSGDDMGHGQVNTSPGRRPSADQSSRGTTQRQ